MGKQEEALELFLTDDYEKACTITKNLNQYNLQRQEIEKNIFDQAIEELQKENCCHVE